MVSLKHVYIPEDIIINILIRVHVKALLHFKAVSNAWLSIISNPTFVALHLHRASENNDSFLAHRFENSFNSISLGCIDPSFDFSYFDGDLCGHMFIAGSYNDIVCAALQSRRRTKFFTISTPIFSPNVHIYLWNPATKQSKLLRSHCSPNSRVWIGFSFDLAANDFKVVEITHNINVVDAMVYSANTKAWKKIEPPPRIPLDCIAHSCVKGFLYWTWEDGMVRFDLNNEVFYSHRFPANVQKTIRLLRGTHCMRVIEMKDSSDVVICSYGGGFKNKVNLWTANDGFEKSWTLKFSFDVSLAVDWLHVNLNNRGDILLKTLDGVWLLYNLDKNKTKVVTLPVGTTETFKHTESLVPIRGFEPLSEMLAKLKMKDWVEQV